MFADSDVIQSCSVFSHNTAGTDAAGCQEVINGGEGHALHMPLSVHPPSAPLLAIVLLPGSYHELTDHIVSTTPSPNAAHSL